MNPAPAQPCYILNPQPKSITMRSFLAILALAGAATGFLEAPIPHQVAPIKASETATFAAVGSTSLFFDDELDNVNIVSDMNIAPSRKCGRCFG
jgi:hypothetical protein